MMPTYRDDYSVLSARIKSERKSLHHNESDLTLNKKSQIQSGKSEQEHVIIKTELSDDHHVTDTKESGVVRLPLALLAVDVDGHKHDTAPECKTPILSAKSKRKPTDKAGDHSAEGILIPWGQSRMRKQPKIYPIPTRKLANSMLAKGDSWMASAAIKKVERQAKATRKLKAGEQETRLKQFRDEPPEWYERALHRANTQRMFVLERTRGFEEDCHANHNDCPYEALEIAGSKGDVYTVKISHRPSCTCPSGIFSSKEEDAFCKHIVYALHHVLKVQGELGYQAAFLTSELKQIFAHAPPLPSDLAEEEVNDGKRKQTEGDCPICFTDLESDGNGVVWCKAACGNNIHQGCFDQWAKAKSKVTCPFCRSEWQFDEMPRAKRVKVTKVNMVVGSGGYQNVYDQLNYANDEE